MADLSKIERLLESIRVNAEGALANMDDWGHVQRSLTMVAEEIVEAQAALHGTRGVTGTRHQSFSPAATDDLAALDARLTTKEGEQ